MTLIFAIFCKTRTNTFIQVRPKVVIFQKVFKNSIFDQLLASNPPPPPHPNVPPPQRIPPHVHPPPQRTNVPQRIQPPLPNVSSPPSPTHPQPTTYPPHVPHEYNCSMIERGGGGGGGGVCVGSIDNFL